MSRYAEIEKALRECEKEMCEAADSEFMGDDYHEAINAAQVALALPEDSKVTDEWPKLDKPARIGPTTFGVGVSSKLVVQCAQRHYDTNPELFGKAGLLIEENPTASGKVVNAELYGLAFGMADNMAAILCALAQIPNSATELLSMPEVTRYLELREQSGEPMPYKVVRDGDKVRFE